MVSQSSRQNGTRRVADSDSTVRYDFADSDLGGVKIRYKEEPDSNFPNRTFPLRSGLLLAIVVAALWGGYALLSSFGGAFSGATSKENRTALFNWANRSEAVEDEALAIEQGSARPSSTTPENRLAYYVQNVQGSEFLRQRLIEQTREIQSQIGQHRQMIKRYHALLIVTVTVVIAATVMALICLVYILKTGWRQSRRSAVLIFATAAGSAILFSAYGIVFRYEHKITNNEQLFLTYAALEDRISSYFATGQFVTTSTQEPRRMLTQASQVIQHVDEELAAISRLAMSQDSLLGFPLSSEADMIPELILPAAESEPAVQTVPEQQAAPNTPHTTEIPNPNSASNVRRIQNAQPANSGSTAD